MRVCHIISGDLWAGAEVMTYNLLKGLLIYPDVELSSILFNEGKLSQEIRKLGIKVDVVDENKLNIFQMISTIQKIIAGCHVDLIHSHRLKENILTYLSAKNKNGVRLLCTQHGNREPLGKQNLIKDFVLYKFHFSIIESRFHYMVAVSEDIQECFIKEYGLPREKIVVIHNGIDQVHDFTQKGDTESFTIGSSGRLFPVKDYLLMVEIAEIINEKENGIRFEIAGEGPEMGKIHNLIQKKKLGEIFSLRGFIENITTFYKGIDLYLNTSIHEGIPMSVLEAMAHGIPVVAPNVGGLKEILEDGVHGYLVEGRCPENFAYKCLNIYKKRSLKKEMGVASKKRIEKEFSIEKMTNKYYELYLDMNRSN